MSDSWDLNMMMLEGIADLRIRKARIPTSRANEASRLPPAGYDLDVLAALRRHRRGEYRRFFEPGHAEASA